MLKVGTLVRVGAEDVCVDYDDLNPVEPLQRGSVAWVKEIYNGRLVRLLHVSGRTSSTWQFGQFGVGCCWEIVAGPDDA